MLKKCGTYTFTASYRSGDSRNALSWSEPDGKITAGTVTAGASDSAGVTHEVTFEVEITKPGAGTLVFTGPDNKSPQLDKFDIVLTEEVDKIADKTDLEIAIQDAERELAKENTYSQETRAQLQAVLVKAKSVFEDPYTTQSVADQ